MPRSNDGLFSAEITGFDEATATPDFGRITAADLLDLDSPYYRGVVRAGEITAARIDPSALIAGRPDYRSEPQPVYFDSISANRLSMTTSFTVQHEGQEMIKITRQGGAFVVEAPGVEYASIAGRVFVESIRRNLEGLR